MTDSLTAIIVVILAIATVVVVVYEINMLVSWRKNWSELASRTGLKYKEYGASQHVAVSGMYKGRKVKIEGFPGAGTEYTSTSPFTRITVSLNREVSSSELIHKMIVTQRPPFNDLTVMGHSLRLSLPKLEFSFDRVHSLLDRLCDIADKVE